MRRRFGAEAGIWLSVAAYILLTAVKLIVAQWTGSLSLQADGFNNLTDVLAAFALLAGVRIARRPRDANHPYGHFRAEVIASLLTSFIMTAIGLQVLASAVSRLAHPGGYGAPEPGAAWVAGISALVMLAVHAVNRRGAKRSKSVALQAMATDNLADALVSFGALAGIMGARLNLPWLDPLTAVLIAGVICRTSYRIFSESATILSDGFDQSKLRRYRETVRAVPGVCEVGDLKARSLGREVVVDVTIKVNPHLSVLESHAIADAVEREMQRRHKVHGTLIHVEPK